MWRMVMTIILKDTDVVEFESKVIVAGSCTDSTGRPTLHRTLIGGEVLASELRAVLESSSSLRVRIQNNCIRKGIEAPEQASWGLFLGMLGEKSSTATKAIAATLEAATDAVRRADEMAKKIADLEAQLAKGAKK
jgi:hypothetical protein